MAKYFVSQSTLFSAPSDSNDGLDMFGFALSAAVYTDTGHGDGSYNITLTDAFAGYSFTAGDQIRIAGTSINDGLYTIGQRNSDHSINLTESAGANSTDVTSSDGPYLTIQYALTNVAVGNYIIAEASETWVLSTQLDVRVATADVRSFQRLVGGNARGLIDGTQARFDFDTQTSGHGITVDTGAAYFYMAHIIVENAYDDGVWFDVSGRLTMENVRVTGSGGNGLWSDNADAGFIGYGCEIDNNGQDGADANGDSRGPYRFYDSSFHHNTDCGVVYGGNENVFENCRVFRNGSDGFQRYAGLTSRTHTHGLTVKNCTIFANGASGIDLIDTAIGNVQIMDTVFRSNTLYGIDCAGDANQVLINENNLFHNNGSGISDVTLPGGVNNLFVDPEFESETDESEDFEPADGSPLIGAAAPYSLSGGTQYLDIGAIQREMAAGGGADACLVPQGLHPIGSGINA